MIESLLGIVLLASVAIYTISSFVVGKYTTRLSRERFVVSNLLREDMENFVAINYSTIADGAVSTNITINDGTRTFPATKTLDSETMDASIYGYKKIYGKIVWISGASNTQSLVEEMVVYVTKK